MGGYMTYQRMRTRNGILYRKTEPMPHDPYFRGEVPWGTTPGAIQAINKYLLVGDLNRMEQDYLGLADPEWHQPDYLLMQVVQATGVPRDDVLKVLRYVFMEQS